MTTDHLALERRVAVHLVTERFPTGEIKTTTYLNDRWIPIDDVAWISDEVFTTPSDGENVVRWAPAISEAAQYWADNFEKSEQ